MRQTVVRDNRNTIAIFDPLGQALVDGLDDDVDSPTALDKPRCEVDGYLFGAAIGEWTAVYECDAFHFDEEDVWQR